MSALLTEPFPGSYGRFNALMTMTHEWLKRYGSDYPSDGCWVGREPRTSFALHHGRDIPQGYQIGHTCANHRCIRPSHLYLCTPKENMAEMQHRRGERVHTFDALYGTHLAWMRGEDLPPIERKKRVAKWRSIEQWRALALVLPYEEHQVADDPAFKLRKLA